MKKSIAILSVLAASAALAVTEVESSNTFGFVPVTGKGLTCVAVPVNGYTTGTSIKIAEVLQVTDLAVDDKLYTMNGGAYNEYVLQDDKTWKASKVVTVAGDGTFRTAAGTPPTEAEIAPGGAFWLDTKATTISVMGDATNPASAATITTGWQLIGNPSMTQAKPIKLIEATAGSILKTATKTYRYARDIGWTTSRKPTSADDVTNDSLAVGEGALIFKK